MFVGFFLHSGAGRIFCTGAIRSDDNSARRTVLVLSPFAEEMNKSRHVLAALCRRIAAAGHDVLLPDLFGTGDSEGDFADARLETWRADIDATIDRLAPGDGVDIVGLRGGALLAVDAVTRHRVRSLTLLHPVVDGRQQLTQFLRLRLAGGLTGDAPKETMAGLRQRLADGEALEIAGYRLSGQLASGLESLSLVAMPPLGVERVGWIDVVAQADRPLMPASQRVIDDWAAQGVGVNGTTVNCDQFWATQEIARCPALLDSAMQRLGA